MTIRLRIISAENDDFFREIDINGDASFLELHHFIQKLLNFDSNQIASFFITDEDWHKNEEITLMDMSFDELHPTYIMSQTQLSHFITDKKQRMIYLFDFFNDRNLYIETYDIDDSDCSHPQCTREKGDGPEHLDISELLLETMSETSESDDFDFEEDYYGMDEDDFNDPRITYTDDLEDY